MGYVRVLDKNVRELISAGEVVERPASVVKELVENSLDASATVVEVSLERNGLSAIQVRDNGKGFERDDVEVAFQRHATSKISTADDLYNIGSFGFRGEALAAICAVSRVQLITKTRESEIGSKYVINGGEPESLVDTGAPEGSIITVRDLFYNTPARMKFLKKDVSEGNAVEQLMIHLALSNPDVSFQLNRDGKTVLRTSGQGLFNTIFELYPREISSHLLEINYTSEYGFLVTGYLAEPRFSRPSRSMQHIAINGRYIKSRTIQSAAEEACRTFVMHGKFPVFVINILMPLDEVDVNVHPAKTEVRFKNDRAVSGAVYHAIQNAIQSTVNKVGDYTVDSVLPAVSEHVVKADPRREERSSSPAPRTPSHAVMQPLMKKTGASAQTTSSVFDFPSLPATNVNLKKVMHKEENSAAEYAYPQTLTGDRHATLKVLGELFETYIVAQNDENLVLIDMHAAHERILFEQLRSNGMKNDSQILLEPVIISLSPGEKQAVLDNLDVLKDLGFVVDEMGQKEIAVRQCPTFLNMKEVSDTVIQIADQLANNRENLTYEAKEWLSHSVACRAAIKAGHRASSEELVRLAEKILCGDIPKYCPHGRPVYVMYSREQLEKDFGRIV